MNKALYILVLSFVILNTASLTLASEKEQIHQNNTPIEYQEGQIIAYFNEVYELVKPEQARYYRQYLGKTTQGWPIIQDFYQSSGQKYCSSYTVKPTENLQSKDILPWEGTINCWFENGQKQIEWFFKNGAANGILTVWNEKGQKELQSSMKNDKPDGSWVTWNEKGQIISKQNFKDGQFDGKQVNFGCSNQNCSKISETHYKNGKGDGKQTYWHENGKKSSTGYMKKGLNEGKAIGWYDNGQKRWEHYFKNGKLNGQNKFWNKNGRLEKTIFWQNGTIIHTTFYNLDGSVKNIEPCIEKCVSGEWDEITINPVK